MLALLNAQHIESKSQIAIQYNLTGVIPKLPNSVLGVILGIGFPKQLWASLSLQEVLKRVFKLS